MNQRKKTKEKQNRSRKSKGVKFNLDEHGTPVSLYVKKRKAAHLLIEDFMLLANRRVAAYIGKQENPDTFLTGFWQTLFRQNSSSSSFLSSFEIESDRNEQYAKW